MFSFANSHPKPKSPKLHKLATGFILSSYQVLMENYMIKTTNKFIV
ncbi:hypothetical protein HanPSC8_Chr06g0244781 [Helianthus annuus]|nr:hypothetical protein HanPSC8_Chr06g0244781 [Helianthus annuus]